MSVLVKVKPPGVPIEVYDKVSAQLGMDSDPPAGLVFHAAHASNGSFAVVEVWESEAQAKDFEENRLKPAIRAVVGDEVYEQMPDAEREFIEIHNLVTS